MTAGRLRHGPEQVEVGAVERRGQAEALHVARRAARSCSTRPSSSPASTSAPSSTSRNGSMLGPVAEVARGEALGAEREGDDRGRGRPPGTRARCPAPSDVRAGTAATSASVSWTTYWPGGRGLARAASGERLSTGSACGVPGCVSRPTPGCGIRAGGLSSRGTSRSKKDAVLAQRDRRAAAGGRRGRSTRSPRRTSPCSSASLWLVFGGARWRSLALAVAEIARGWAAAA